MGHHAINAALAPTIALCKAHLKDIEAQLDATDPQRVVACKVQGYTDPPARIVAAEHDRANGVFHAGPMTVEAVKALQAGQFKVPSMKGLTNHQIHHAKLQAIRYRLSLSGAEATTKQP